MSTKTTFKRIALATVAAMGFGLLSVVPANAAIVYGTVVLDNTVTSFAGRVGNQVSITVTGDIAAVGATTDPDTANKDLVRIAAETRPPLAREPGSGLELTPKS